MEGIVGTDRLIRVMRGYNPWWEGRDGGTPTFKRVSFMLARTAIRDQKLHRAIILSGPRRVGKSTVLRQLALDQVLSGRDPRSILYLSLDDNLLKLTDLPDLLRLYRERIFPEGPETLLLLDEVHYAPGWDQHMKTLVDHHPEYRIVATGSASLEYGLKGPHSGVGRWYTIHVPTLSFFEFVHMRDNAAIDPPEKTRVLNLWNRPPAEFATLASRLRPLMPLFRRYLLVGGFPETARLDDITECQRLVREDIVDRVLKHDVVSLFGVRNVGDLEKIFLYICLHTGGLFNVQDCARDMGLARTAVNSHIDVLRAANLLYRLSPDATGGKKILKARHKFYLVDAGIRNAVFLTGESILSDPTEMGLIVETAVLRHLFACYFRESPAFTYWRDAKTDLEVDIVQRMGRWLFAFEVKYRDRARKESTGGLAAFCAKEPDAWPFLITQSDEDFAVEPLAGHSRGVLRIPAHIFCYLIGQSERWIASEEP